MSPKRHFPLVLTRLIEERPCISFPRVLSGDLTDGPRVGKKRWWGVLGATHPPVTAVKGLRSNHLHMTTRPAPHLNSEWLMRPCGTPFLVLFSGGRVICMIAASGNTRNTEKADRTGRQCSVSTYDIDQVMCSANDAAWLNTWTPLERSLAIQDPGLMYSSSALLKALSNSLKPLPICFWRKIQIIFHC